ncbi:MAG: hypothetical protein O7C59_10290 [Rickettsia endosymbiont of Ixodes persulcatus]|nr:hypothetical protein [Rickettsia endosymbiont of Ixodes persulcatus]
MVMVWVWDEQVVVAYRESFDQFMIEHSDIEVRVNVVVYLFYFDFLRIDVVGYVLFVFSFFGVFMFFVLFMLVVLWLSLHCWDLLGFIWLLLVPGCGDGDGAVRSAIWGDVCLVSLLSVVDQL